MNSQNFDQLMKGIPANWAKMEGQENRFLSAALTKEEKIEALKDIENRQEPVPDKIRSEINEFVAQHKKLGTKERTVRRLVKRFWNIEVI